MRYSESSEFAYAIQKLEIFYRNTRTPKSMDEVEQSKRDGERKKHNWLKFNNRTMHAKHAKTIKCTKLQYNFAKTL